VIDSRLCELIHLGAPIWVIFGVEEKRNRDRRSMVMSWRSGSIDNRNSNGCQIWVSELFVLAGIGLKKLLAMSCLYLEPLNSHPNRRKMWRSWLLEKHVDWNSLLSRNS
jgi:hypothetical protein